MDNEIEAQFLDIDKETICAKLKEVGAKLVKPEVMMRRVVFDIDENRYARVRDEGGGKIVMTYKNVEDEGSILGVKEVNVEIDDFDNGITFLKACGLKAKAEQETYREVWTLGEAEICIDTWPWIPTFVEIEGPDEETVWKTAKKLELSREKAKYGSVGTTYQHYYDVDTETVNRHTPKILFDMEPPEWAKSRK